jgi:hypothetical protein
VVCVYARGLSRSTCYVYYVKNGRPTEHLNTVRRAIKLLASLYGEARAADFGPLALRSVRQYMIDNPLMHPVTKRELTYARSTINATVGAICRIFSWASSLELVPVTVHQALRTVPGLKKGPHGRPGAQEGPPGARRDC